MKALIVLVLTILAAVLAQTQIVLAYPCSGGSGKDYCSGYHKGAVQADKDDAKGNVDVSQHPCSGSADYCRGYITGYDQEAGLLQ